MKCIMVLVALAGIASVPAPAQETTAASETLMHRQTSFTLVVPLAYAETAPLFGPEGERAWAGKHWDPHFIYPQPARDIEGAVFTVSHGSSSVVWVNTAFDTAGRHFQYVYFMANLMVTTIDVRFKTLDAATTQVDVVYARTALSADGNEHVGVMSENDKRAGKDWQDAIGSYLAERKPATHH